MLLIILSFLLSITFWLWIIRKYDKFEREPLKSVLFVLITGGLMSTVPAALLNSAFRGLLDRWDITVPGMSGYTLKLMLYHAFVGINEETLKAVVTVLLISRMKGFNEPADALVYAMTVALGFAVVENASYSMRFGFAAFFIRQFNAVPLHLGVAAIWGIGIARAKFLHGGGYFRWMAPYLLAAAFLHFLYNLSTLVPGNNWLAVLIPTVIAFILVLLAIRRVKKYSVEGPFSRMVPCPRCHTGNTVYAGKCYKCGGPLILEFYKICPGCHSKVIITSSDCPNCGAALERSPEGSK